MILLPMDIYHHEVQEVRAGDKQRWFNDLSSSFMRLLSTLRSWPIAKPLCPFKFKAMTSQKIRWSSRCIPSIYNVTINGAYPSSIEYCALGLFNMAGVDLNSPEWNVDTQHTIFQVGKTTNRKSEDFISQQFWILWGLQISSTFLSSKVPSKGGKLQSGQWLFWLIPLVSWDVLFSTQMCHRLKVPVPKSVRWSFATMNSSPNPKYFLLGIPANTKVWITFQCSQLHLGSSTICWNHLLRCRCDYKMRCIILYVCYSCLQTRTESHKHIMFTYKLRKSISKNDIFLDWRIASTIPHHLVVARVITKHHALGRTDPVRMTTHGALQLLINVNWSGQSW